MASEYEIGSSSTADPATVGRQLYSNKVIVGAIDFGTTYSGYAYSLGAEFNLDPTKVSANTGWVGGDKLLSHKTPTVVLLNPDKTFKAFGYEAETQYGQLAEDDADRDDGVQNHTQYYYFRRFKMNLYNQKSIARNTELVDIQGKKMNAIDVFSICIKYLSDELKKLVNSRGTVIIDSDYHWVLTVPAIWEDAAKQFMREAAEKAGLDGKKLTIALEPEAASLFCMHVPVNKMNISGGSASSSGISAFPKGTRYMVVDAGGGTIDITVHEVIGDGKLKELNYASGGAWGGTRVDEKYEEFLHRVFGKDALDKLGKKHVEDLINLHRAFEVKKRNVNDNTDKETIQLPALLGTLCKSDPKTVIKNNSSFAGKITYAAGKIRIDGSMFRGFFDESCYRTIGHIRDVLRQPASKGVDTILLVGGFSESPLLQEKIKSNFSDKRIIIPPDAGLAVLKGAVMFGHDPLIIKSRVAKCSYGISVYRDFDPTIHPPSKRVILNGVTKCKDIFAPHVKKGEELLVGVAQTTQRYAKLDEKQISLDFDIYTSTRDDPKFVTDPECQYLGQLEVDIAAESGKENGIFVRMIFGGTELIVEAEDEKTKKVKKTTFHFLK